MNKFLSLLLLSTSLFAESAFLDIQKVRSNDTLNIRENANYKSKKIATIPYNATCVINHGCGQDISYDILIHMDEEGVKAFLAQANEKWCYVSYDGKMGWANKYYLKESTSECK